ncbi:MAG TPA: enolase C-terminal domain-like protein [Methylomirabilota bacterium]|nr:enolase C-terminal domain-like protein [Methylomirabilota bacterium]
MSRSTDVQVVGAELYFLPVRNRMPLKFGSETLTSVVCARTRVVVTDRSGRRAAGWGETPLSVQWVWPGAERYEDRLEALQEFCRWVGEAWVRDGSWGHPMELGHDFCAGVLPGLLGRLNQEQRAGRDPMPRLAALLCASAYDVALHDAYGRLHDRPVYDTYCREFMSRDLAAFLEPARGAAVSFAGRYPHNYLMKNPAVRLRAWHLVGGLDPLEPSDRNGTEPADGYPVLLTDWIQRDGLKCLKVKLRGNDATWDYRRLVAVGRLACAQQVDWLTADFNCTVDEPAYVNAMLDQLRDEHPRLYGMILYVEQPFPYDLETHRIDVHGLSARKPLFLDESAHDWRQVRLGRELGWTGVALKTCKTQTGALLSACWARAHGMALMVQDLTNPMLAQIPHVLLAAHVGTIMGVETNAMQFYPEASAPEAAIHPGLYRRVRGEVDLSTVRGAGFGYRVEEIPRTLPRPDAVFGETRVIRA